MGRDRDSGLKWGGRAGLRGKKTGKRDLRTLIVDPLYQHERNENASFWSIFNGGGRPKWRFSNFPRF